jgi:hypothetical protein
MKLSGIKGSHSNLDCISFHRGYSDSIFMGKKSLTEGDEWQTQVIDSAKLLLLN